MIVGTAGHIDHGKTALVKALTGVDTDRLKEEKARGITIELGFAYSNFGNGSVTGFVDVPGHERFIHTMLAGACGIDYALLVVAADDGIMPQTLEHLAILNLLGINRGVVALTKADLADDIRRASLTLEVRTMLRESSLRDVVIMCVSAMTGEGIEALKHHLAEAEREATTMSASGRFRLAVDRCFILPGAGTVVTGSVISGRVALGDLVTLSPSGLPARVRSIHAQNRTTGSGSAGERCALNLSGDGVSKDAIRRGDMVVDPVLHAPADRIDAELAVLASEKRPLGEWFSARLHHASTEVGVRIVPLGLPISPGQSGRAQLVLDRAIAAAIGDRFIIRDVSAQRTIGGGKFLDLRAPARKRKTAERRELLNAAARQDAPEALVALLAVLPFVVDLDAFARDRALAKDELSRIITTAKAEVIVTSQGRYALSKEARIEFTEHLQRTLTAFHGDNPDLQGIGRERLRMLAMPRLPKPAFLVMLREEQEAGRLVMDGSFVRLPGHEVRLTEKEEALYAKLVPHMTGDERFRPPRVRDFCEMIGADEKEVRRILKLCARLGRVDQIRHDHFFARRTTAEMVEIIREVAASADNGEFFAGAFRDRVNNGRKVAIEILEFFDRQGVTFRRGDVRRVNPHRLDLYGEPRSGSG
ncbi:selenocysteine-specific translation elongation factor [Rhizobium grahamii]|uniref:Selenocysteine-specific elongation factor n=1 Tax=Rhizobium grahamii CCGE 502 TaxID=990285 RepID=S3IBV8_9HYPH|nr:selenocysteine-specific translation elongation factor [Rhizobium grahamii]EPE96693.1 selenocysteine-specific translation elongation factor [Rhizobium grahamii CCGE 502]